MLLDPSKSEHRIRESAFLAGAGQKDLVSVIIPAFNRQSLILDAMDSLARQSYRPIQIIVVDDGSSDETSRVARDWAIEHPQIWVSVLVQSNKGVSGARNTGLRRALGEYVYFLDSDDVVLPRALPLMVNALELNPGAPFALGCVDNTDMAGDPIPEDYSGLTHMRGGDLLRNHWLLFTALYRREALRKAGPFNESLKMGEDTELNWRVLLRNGEGVRCNAILGHRRHHEHGHLYLDSDHAERMLRSLEMHEALACWLSENPQYRGTVIARGLLAIHNYYQRLGQNQGDPLWNRVHGLFDDLSPDTPRANTVFRFFVSSRRRRKTYRLLYRIYRSPVNARRRLRIFLAGRGVDVSKAKQLLGRGRESGGT